ncbi:MAG: cell division protein FtsQ/DivIB [Xanthomonadaceae bacterium]|nr:cell division protein FtsQ/DivIB [Xanthomonadaceae bacterium]
MGAAHWPLRTLRVTGQLQRVDRAQLQATVMPLARRGFFAVNLGDVQQAVKRLPWVERAEVRKHWPDVLEVQIREFKPFARWGEQRLLSEHGELFPVGKLQVPAGMPQLDGPEARVPEVVALYHQAGKQLAGVGGVLGVALDRRGSWSVTLRDGTRLVLGRNDPQLRLERFAALLPQLQAMNGTRRLQRADLRYTNGFALHWGKPAPAPVSAAAPSGTAAAAPPNRSPSTTNHGSNT